MTRVEKVVQNIIADIKDKLILEVACGCAAFSVAASNVAENVYCIDLDDTRLPGNIGSYSNIHFEKMDAIALCFEDKRFDTVVLYNAIGHLAGIVPQVVSECIRVTKDGGKIYVISSSKMDKAVIRDELLPHLHSTGIVPIVTEDKIFISVQIYGRTAHTDHTIR